MRERDAAERSRLVERRNMSLSKEVIELTEDNCNTRRLFLFNEELVRQPLTLLDEALYEEEVVLSALLRAEVQETWIKIQANNSVQMNVLFSTTMVSTYHCNAFYIQRTANH